MAFVPIVLSLLIKTKRFQDFKLPLIFKLPNFESDIKSIWCDFPQKKRDCAIVPSAHLKSD